MSTKIYKSILVLSDKQMPYEHPQSVPFIRAVAKKHKIDLKGRNSLIVDIGDEFDVAALSDYVKNEDLYSDGDEVNICIKKLRVYKRLMPRMSILTSNHVNRIGKRLKKAGLSAQRLKGLHDTYKLPKGWKYFKKIVVKIPIFGELLLQHGHQGDALDYSRSHGTCVASGHTHTKCYISYWKDSLGRLRFAAQIGCMIDNKSEAFDYDKDNKNAPVLSLLVIINGLPHIELMLTDKKGNWIGRLA